MLHECLDWQRLADSFICNAVDAFELDVRQARRAELYGTDLFSERPEHK